jgi:hypothetical protein
MKEPASRSSLRPGSRATSGDKGQFFDQNSTPAHRSGGGIAGCGRQRIFIDGCSDQNPSPTDH